MDVNERKPRAMFTYYTLLPSPINNLRGRTSLFHHSAMITKHFNGNLSTAVFLSNSNGAPGTMFCCEIDSKVFPKKKKIRKIRIDSIWEMIKYQIKLEMIGIYFKVFEYIYYYYNYYSNTCSENFFIWIQNKRVLYKSDK